MRETNDHRPPGAAGGSAKRGRSADRLGTGGPAQAAPPKGMRLRLVMLALWNGRLPLARAFWQYAILYGTTVSIAATAAALAGFALGLPGLLAFAIHLLPLPYIFVAAVGVWRSASRYSGPPVWARSAEAAIVIWAGLMVLV